jgi:hypothetical protein
MPIRNFATISLSLPLSFGGHSASASGTSSLVAAQDVMRAFAIVGCAATILREIEPVREFVGQAPIQERSG